MLRLTVDLSLAIEFFDEPEVADVTIHLLTIWFPEDTSYPGELSCRRLPTSEATLKTAVRLQPSSSATQTCIEPGARLAHR